MQGDYGKEDFLKGDFFKAWYLGVLPEWGAPSAVRYFTDVGSWDLNFGDAQVTYLGSRFVNAFGNDSRLVFSPLSWLPGAFNRNPFIDFLLGLGDDVSFCYGSRITTTYGGPAATINRCPRINKNGVGVRLSGPLPGTGLNRAYDAWQDVDRAEPNVIDASDGKVNLAVLALNVLLNLTTAIIDMWAHFTYEQYDPQTGKWSLREEQKGDLATELGKLELSHRVLPRRLMAVIYHLEICELYGNLAAGLKEYLVGTVKKLGGIALAVATMGLVIPLAWALLGEGWKKTRIVVGIITVILIIVFAVIAIVAATA